MKNYKIKALAIPSFLIAISICSVDVTYAADTNSSSDKPVTEQLVDTMTLLAHGPYNGYRANHAKGIMARGTFTPSASAAGLSKAAHLQKASIPVLVRFSDTTGVPTIPDADPNASPHGMAIRFTLPDGSETDIVSISANSFPAATPEDFLGFLNAIAASGPDAPKPTPIEQFFGTHPAALKFATTPYPPPVSFATQAFYGVNAFKFTNAKGKTQYGRYRIMPMAGNHSLTKAQAAKAAPNYLMDELPKHLTKHKIKFILSVQLAEKGDVINDDTAVWPDSRPQVKLGTLTIDKIVPDSAELEKTFMYSPLNLTDGIDASDDPILNARPQAYAISFGRRFGGGS